MLKKITIILSSLYKVQAHHAKRLKLSKFPELK